MCFFHTYTTNSLFCYAKKYTYVTCAMVQHISCWLNQFPGVIFKRIASLVISFCRWLRLFLSQREIGAIYPNNLLTPLGKRSFMQADRSGPIESDQKGGKSLLVLRPGDPTLRLIECGTYNRANQVVSAALHQRDSSAGKAFGLGSLCGSDPAQFLTCFSF